jgi:hypothetical protein
MAGPWEKYQAPSQSAGPWSKYAPLAQPKTFEREGDETLYRQELAAEQERRSKPRVPISGIEEPATAEEAAISTVQQQRAKESEQQAFDDSRTPLKRATDASTFALSAPIRALTRGEYGLGDVAERCHRLVPGAPRLTACRRGIVVESGLIREK